MTENDKNWNYDRIRASKAQIDMVVNDMMTMLQRGYVSSSMKYRMVEFMKNAAEDIEAMRV